MHLIFLGFQNLLLEIANKGREPHHVNVVEPKFHQRKSQPLEEQYVQRTAWSTSDAHLDAILKFCPMKHYFRSVTCLSMGEKGSGQCQTAEKLTVFQTLKER